MWKFFLLVLFFVLSVQNDQKKPLNSIYVNAVRCNFSDHFVHKNVSCFAKSYNRSFSGVNIIATFKESMMTHYISIKLFYKYGIIYREVIGSPMVDICAVMNPSFSNRWVRMVMDMINDSVPGSIHECPYSFINVRNASVNTQAMPSVFPSGDYKLILYLNKDPDTIFMTINMMGTLTSSLKENFG